MTPGAALTYSSAPSPASDAEAPEQRAAEVRSASWNLPQQEVAAYGAPRAVGHGARLAVLENGEDLERLAES